MDSDQATSRKREGHSDSTVDGRAESTVDGRADSTGDRRGGSVGERPELAGSRDSGNRGGGSGHKKHSLQEELDNTTANDPGLGGE